ncbi:MAG: hypothetical protein AAF340_16395 [Pseudomonadota bacterium]
MRAWLFGFLGLGLLVGTIAGLSTAALTVTLLTLLFSLFGGSLVVFINKLDSDQRTLAGAGLAVFSLSCTIALYASLTVRLNDLLIFQELKSEREAVVPSPNQQPAQRSYPRSGVTELTNALTPLICNGQLTLTAACLRIEEAEEQ